MVITTGQYVDLGFLHRFPDIKDQRDRLSNSPSTCGISVDYKSSAIDERTEESWRDYQKHQVRIAY